ncbi:MAG: DUF4405 domain-containing protein [Deltaproteobacteria bacterium]|nr:DUF4405 domain-containing protein [Deltaproteobacteria bacterium]
MRATTDELVPLARRAVSWLGHPAYPWVVIGLGLAALAAMVTGVELAHHPAPEAGALHGWLGLVVSTGMLMHLFAHRGWLGSTVGALLGKRPAPRGWFQVALLAVAAVALAISGIALVDLGGGTLARGGAWQGLHHLSSKVLLALGIWHVVRHRRWLATKLLASPPG